MKVQKFANVIATLISKYVYNTSAISYSYVQYYIISAKKATTMLYEIKNIVQLHNLDKAQERCGNNRRTCHTRADTHFNVAKQMSRHHSSIMLLLTNGTAYHNAPSHTHTHTRRLPDNVASLTLAKQTQIL